MFGSLKVHLNKILNPAKGVFKSIFKIDPHNNWILLVIVFIILNVFFLSKNTLEFYEIGSDKSFLSEGSTKVNLSTINRSNLEDVLFEFETKKVNLDSLKVNRPIFSDPSI